MINILFIIICTKTQYFKHFNFNNENQMIITAQKQIQI